MRGISVADRALDEAFYRGQEMEDRTIWAGEDQDIQRAALRLQGYSQRSTVYFNHVLIFPWALIGFCLTNALIWYYYVTLREPDERIEGYDALAE